MNPLTNVKNIQKLNEREINLGISGTASWHNQYKDSAWIFVGGLPYQLSEGDILTVFSQYGEIVNINLVRDKSTGKSKGFCFICYEDQRSTILAVDNLNSIQLSNRTIRVDHVLNYKVPKEYDNEDEITKKLKNEGCAPQPLQNDESSNDSLIEEPLPKKVKKAKKKKKKKKSKKQKKDNSSSSSDSEPVVKVKTEKDDGSYDKYLKKSSSNGMKNERSRSSSIERPHRSGESIKRHVKTEKFRSRSRSVERKPYRSHDSSSNGLTNRRSRSRSKESSHRSGESIRHHVKTEKHRSRSRSLERKSYRSHDSRYIKRERSNERSYRSERRRSRSRERYQRR